MSRRPVIYSLYGLACASPLRLPCPTLSRRSPVDVEFVRGAASHFVPYRSEARPARGWFRSRRFDDGSVYLRWTGEFEFLVSGSGRRIAYRGLPATATESLRQYLVTQALSFALVKSGNEPLHGTAVAVGQGSAVFLGECGTGKSTIGAALLRAGCALITDDLVSLERRGGGYRIHPGIPRIKLFPAVARSVLGISRGTRLVRGTPKLILPVSPTRTARAATPLTAVYVLAPAPRAGAITIRKLSRRAAMLSIVRHSFNAMVDDADRLGRQFTFASELVRRVPVLRLTYPRRLAMLESVCAMLVRDVGRRRA